ncbi:DUF2278 family protein [Parachitinimonas caeni]|uniref:DUF2278 family protein n=1 Tax=Parachitinimonas caeni TaxID=3031301 RepID=A0ABT7E0E0_9NEIS|nr:DUF2278 family protein [Parachitinimonas caeni]MDK2125778.1 DUF2278 family protein [Parachitinimonas caeni]
MPFSGNKTYGFLALTVTEVEGTHTSSYSGLSHFNLIGSDGNRNYQVNIDSQSSSSPNVMMINTTVSAKDMQNIILAPLSPFSPGFLPLRSQPGSGALDLIRQSEFTNVVQALAECSPASANQIGSQLSAALTTGAQLLVFGTYYDDEDDQYRQSSSYGHSRYQENSSLPPRGMDDVHLNQGTPSSQHQSADNGIYQDGALFILNQDGSANAFFFMFSGQCLQTDNNGNCQGNC